MSQAKLFVLMRQKQHISCLPIHAQDNSRGFRRELQIGSEDVSFVPKGLKGEALSERAARVCGSLRESAICSE